MSALRISRLALAIGVACVVTAIPAQAAGPVALTPQGGDNSICGSGGAIPGFVAAVAKSKPAPMFPEFDVTHDSEGWVRIGFTIDSDGDTRDIVILDRVGSKRMISAAISAIRKWDYKPATVNGQPADQYGNTVEILYALQNGQARAVHPNVIELYDRGRTLVAGGKIAEGIAVLESARDGQLNLFEQAMISFALAYAYNQSGNPSRALPYIRHAMIEDGAYLEKRILNPAKRLRIRLEALSGNLHYVACAPSLAATDDFDPKGTDRADLLRLIANAAGTLKSKAPLSQPGKLERASDDDDDIAVWEHPLSRPKFTFTSVNGTLSKLRVNCVVHVVEDTAKPATQWTLPDATGPCILRVYGEAGTSFKLIEEW
jgi:TonB family protein